MVIINEATNQSPNFTLPEKDVNANEIQSNEITTSEKLNDSQFRVIQVKIKNEWYFVGNNEELNILQDFAPITEYKYERVDAKELEQMQPFDLQQASVANPIESKPKNFLPKKIESTSNSNPLLKPNGTGKAAMKIWKRKTREYLDAGSANKVKTGGWSEDEDDGNEEGCCNVLNEDPVIEQSLSELRLAELEDFLKANPSEIMKETITKNDLLILPKVELIGSDSPWVEVIPLVTDDPTTFWARFPWQEQLFKKLCKELNDFYTCSKNTVNKADGPVNEQLVVCLDENGCYQRAKILDLQPDSNMCLVRFLDLGFLHAVPIDLIKELDPQFTSDSNFEQCAFRCNIICSPGLYPESIYHLRDILVGKIKLGDKWEEDARPKQVLAFKYLKIKFLDFDESTQTFDVKLPLSEKYKSALSDADSNSGDLIQL